MNQLYLLAVVCAAHCAWSFSPESTARPYVYSSVYSNRPRSFYSSGHDFHRRSDRLKSGREIIVNPDPTTDSTIGQPQTGCGDRDCDVTAEDSSPPPTFKPFSQEELNKFLRDYAATHGKPPTGPAVEPATNKLHDSLGNEHEIILPTKAQEKSKSWHLIKSQTHNHPYDDRTGWVTLEPVPWSASQIQKWEPNSRPLPHWEEQGWTKPQGQHSHPQAHWSSPKPQPYKPSYDYQKPGKPEHWSETPHYSKPQQQPGWQQIWNSGSDIITDGRPGGFPSAQQEKPWYDRPHQTEVVHYGHKEAHPPGHPSDGDGQWVLLSSTKGYSYPHRNKVYQRALTLKSSGPDSGPDKPTAAISSHRTVRLTVLPALTNQTNTTTSHGGLLEVEQTFQSVDEAQREHAAKMLRLERLNKTSPHPAAAKRIGTSVRVFPVTNAEAESRNNNAVLAAVGAGMIPATMAMLLPMVLGRKRRSLAPLKPPPAPWDPSH